MEVDLPLAALRMALDGRSPGAGLVHHSDRGSVYASKEYTDLLKQHDAVISMSRRGNPFDNAACERFGGTLRRECLDFLIPFNERHLRLVLNNWIAHFNHARPHMSLGPGIPAALRPPAEQTADRHRIAAGHMVRRAAVLGGLHHEYWLEEIAA